MQSLDSVDEALVPFGGCLPRSARSTLRMRKPSVPLLGEQTKQALDTRSQRNAVRAATLTGWQPALPFRGTSASLLHTHSPVVPSAYAEMRCASPPQHLAGLPGGPEAVVAAVESAAAVAPRLPAPGAGPAERAGRRPERVVVVEVVPPVRPKGTGSRSLQAQRVPLRQRRQRPAHRLRRPPGTPPLSSTASAQPRSSPPTWFPGAGGGEVSCRRCAGAGRCRSRATGVGSSW